MKNRLDKTTWNDSLSGALRAFKLGDLDLAEQRLDKAFAAGGNDIPYLHLLAGHIANTRGATAEAEKSWQRVHEIDPENAEAWNNLGVLYRKRGYDDKALVAFQEASTLAPDRPDIPYNIGNLHKAGGRFDEAVTAYNRAIEIDSGYAPAYNNLGTLYESRKERDKALEVFKRGLSVDRGDASIRFNMGLVLQEESRWDEARDAFDRALKSRPGWVPGLNNLGIVLQEMGREDEAARTFRTLLDIEPDNVSALNNLGVAYDRLGRPEDARKFFKKALKEEPDYVKAALNLHDSYHDGQQLNEALEEINKQITHHPRDPEIRVRMGRTLMGLTRWDEAERSLDHVLERNPEHSEALRAKAELFLATRRPDEAESILKRLPHDPDVVRDLARLNISTNRNEDAERLLSELAAVNPDDAESRRLLSEILAEGRPEEAAKLREEASDAEPGDTEDLISLASLYGKTGSRDRAMEKLDEAVNLLGARGEAEDLDAMDEVLGLYEKAAEALEGEKGSLFAERTAQLGRKLQSAMGGGGHRDSHRGRFATQEIPLEQEDALSLLDLNAMEPVIRINEEEETVYLDESAEDLDDAYTELSKREALRTDPGNPSERPGGYGGPGGAPEEGAGGPPVHIHLPAQSAVPQPPQVIYQDIRPVTRETPPVPASPPPREPQAAVPEMVVEEIVEEEIPVLEEENEEGDDSMELVLEEEPGEEPVEETEEELETTDDDADEAPVDSLYYENGEEPFFIPESDALSEDLPEYTDPVLPDADLFFPPGEEPEIEEESMLLEEAPDELVLVEEFEDLADLEEETPLTEEAVEELAEELEEPPEDETSEKMADMFKYLSDLTDEAVGEGRQHLIEEGVPLKLAGLHARLSGEPRFLEVAQKYDRRRRERHNIELDEEKIRGSLNAFKELAAAYPNESVGESLSQKLGKIMSIVTGSRKDGEKDQPSGEQLQEAPEPGDTAKPGEATPKKAAASEPKKPEAPTEEDDYAAVLPEMDND